MISCLRQWTLIKRNGNGTRLENHSDEPNGKVGNKKENDNESINLIINSN